MAVFTFTWRFARGCAWVCAAASILSLAPAQAAHSATFRDLYTVVVTPSEDANDRRADGIRRAMGKLLTRVTGRRDAGWDPDLADLVEGADQYVDAVGFETADKLMVRFDGAAVERALTQLNRPVWGPERPLTLIWVAVDGPLGERGILAADEVGQGWSPQMTDLMRAVREQLQSVADERGLPVTLPLLDLEDLSKVSFADIWGGFTDRIEQASSRYGADAVLIGRARPSDYGLEVRWTLVERGRRRLLAGGDVRDGLDWLADQYAAELATVGGARTERITVLDVHSLDDYGRVMRYVENLSVLDSVQVESLDQGTLRWRGAARGDRSVLERVLALGGVVKPSSPANQGSPPSGDALVFQLVR
jgi:hypothetical protein